MALLALFVGGLGLAGVQLWAHHHARRAKQALERYHPEEAARHLSQCLRVWPDSPSVLLLAAQAARRGDDLKEAEQFLRAYRQQGGAEADEQYVLERTLQAAQQGNVDAVLKWCQARVEQNHPDSGRIFEALVLGYLRDYRVNDAEVTVRIWLDRFPGDPQALYLRGWVKEHRDVPDRAAQDYRRVLELDPSRADVRARLATALLEAAQPAEALEQLEELCRSWPNRLPLQILRARALYAVGQEEEARAVLDDLIAAYPRFAPALTERGRLTLQQGDPRRAANWLEEAVALAPGQVQGWYLLYQARSQLGQAKEADAALEHYQSLQKDQRRIREIATHELSLRPNDPELLHEVGVMLLRGGQPQEAVRWLKRALEKDPNHQAAHTALADYYQKIGQIGLASQHRQKAGEKTSEIGH
jgi:Tfp pilus assembly protein PilF